VDTDHPRRRWPPLMALHPCKHAALARRHTASALCRHPAFPPTLCAQPSLPTATISVLKTAFTGSPPHGD
jgi:hypothetical protein